MIRLIRNILTLAAITTVTINASAQDLLASRAPSDRRLSDLKIIKFSNTPAFIDLNNPASDIYSTWDDKSALVAPGNLPANFKVDLRGFAMPTPSRKVTSGFGPRWGRTHKGIDLKVYTGDTIYAAFDGKVRITKYDGNGWGYYIVIRHPNGLETLYGHLSKQIVKENQIVRAGQPIGLGGNTGKSTGSHLHFETRLLGQAINPALMFDFAHQDVIGDYYVVKSGQIQNSHHTAQASTIAAASAPRHEEALKTFASHQQSTIITQHASTPQQTSVPQSSVQQPSPAIPQQNATYTVMAGDNLFRIATNHGLTLNKLCELNGIKPNSVISAGQVLRIK